MSLTELFPSETMMQLLDKGALSKEFLDAYQIQLQKEDNIEQIDAAKNIASDKLAEAIATDPLTEEIVTDAAKKLGIDVEALLPHIRQAESGGNPNAVSPAGAKGAYQIMDATGEELAAKRGVKYDPFDEEQNKMLAGDYMTQLLTKYGGDKERALMAYNAGMGNVDKAISAASRAFETPTPTPQQIGMFLPKPGETVPYVNKVMSGYAAANPAPTPTAVASPAPILPDPNQMPPAAVSDEPLKPAQPESLAREDMQVATVNAANKAAEAGDVPATLGLKQRGLEMQKQAALDAAAAEVNAGKQVSAALEQVYNDATTKAASTAIDIQKQRDEIDKVIAEQKQAISNYSKMTIDPNRIYARQSTGDKILAAIGIGLASLGEGSNRAVDAINEAIRRDIDIQKAEIDVAGNAISARNTLIGQLNNSFNNSVAAENLAKSIMLERAKARVEQVAANAQSQKAAANAQKIIGELNVQQADAIQKAQEASSIDVMAKQLADSEGNINYAALPPDKQALAVPGLGIAASKEAATKLQAAQAGYKGAMTILDDLQKARETYGVEYMDSAPRAKASSQVGQFLFLIKNLEQTGALDNGTIEVTKDILPQDILSAGKVKHVPGVDDPVLAKIQEAKEYITRQLYNRAESMLVVKDPTFRASVFKRDAKKSGEAKNITDTDED